MIGISYRQELAPWLDTCPEEVECLEIIAEHFFDGGFDRLRTLSKKYPLSVHGLGMSLGTPGPLDHETLERFARVVDVCDPLWVSEHVAFTRTNEVDLGHLNPVRPGMESINVIAEHAHAIVERCGKPLILENITTDLQIQGTISEPEFLNCLCEAADCGLLLDVTNLYINARNHGFDARRWLHEIEPHRIVQLHVVGYSRRSGRWRDLHAEAIQDDLWTLIEEAIDYAPIKSVILERDWNFPPTFELAAELRRLREWYVRH